MEKVDLNPFELLHEHIHELIIQHLKGSEVLECSLVSPKWHKTLGSSRNAMKRVLLKFMLQENSDKFFIESMMCLLQSTRSYQNVWTSYVFGYKKQFVPALLKVFRKFSDSIVSMDVEKDFAVNNLHLTALEDLLMHRSVEQNGVITATSNLVRLKFTASQKPPTPLNFILGNHRLQELDFNADSIENWFSNPFDPVNFRLKKLRMYSTADITPQMEPHLTRFLLSQKDSLESLRVERDGWQNTLHNILGSMKVLKMLHVSSDFSNVNFPMNESITELIMVGKNHNSIDIDCFKSFIRTLSNLKTVSTDIEFIPKNDLVEIIKNNPKLEELKSRFLENVASTMNAFNQRTYGNNALQIVALPEGSYIYVRYFGNMFGIEPYGESGYSCISPTQDLSSYAVE